LYFIDSLSILWIWRWDSNQRPADYKSYYYILTNCFYWYYIMVFLRDWHDWALRNTTVTRIFHARITQSLMVYGVYHSLSWSISVELPLCYNHTQSQYPCSFIDLAQKHGNW